MSEGRGRGHEADTSRRRLLAGSAALAALGPPWGEAARAQQAGAAVPAALVGAVARVALLIGNRDYPKPQDLPPMHKNVRDLGAALTRIGFLVTELLDQDRADALAAVGAFTRRLGAMPPNGVALFYYCGHGMQVDSENFLMPARKFSESLGLSEAQKQYVALWREVVETMPRRPDGMTITVIDACRTGRAAIAAVDGLNQVRARDGEVIVFSTGAGQPAIVSNDPQVRTYFTDSLVRKIERQYTNPDELSFKELFEQVKDDVQKTMAADKDEFIRRKPQVPFVSPGRSRAIRVAIRILDKPAVPAGPASAGVADPALEEAARVALNKASWPKDILRLASEFMHTYPNSVHFASASLAQAGAERAHRLLFPDLQAQQIQRIGLQRRDFELHADAVDQVHNEDLQLAGRGDMAAAARVAAKFKPNVLRLKTESLLYEKWLMFAAALGDGIASFDLSTYYLEVGQPSEGGKWESRAISLGYNPPPSLRKTR